MSSPLRAITLTEIRQNAFEEVHRLEGNEKDFFKVQTANEWIEQAKMQPIPNSLFSEFWNQYELCTLFADTGIGKSILAVQIARSISEGEPINGFKMEAEKQPVLYFDFELSAKQFEKRYSSEYQNHYIFDDNFIRVEINQHYDHSKSDEAFADLVALKLEETICNQKAKIVIVDNLTWVKNDLDKSKYAAPLMKHFNGLKSKYALSILVLAHTRKRDFTKPIQLSDLSGSATLSNFLDNSFAIGRSFKDPALRYLIQLKPRNTDHIFHSDNVCVCRLEKPSNFLQFQFIENATEREHLKQISDREIESRDAEILRLHEIGESNYKIAEQLSISEGTVRNRLKKLRL